MRINYSTAVPVLIVALLLLLGMAHAWRSFSADMSARVAHSYLDQWPKTAGKIKAAEWNRAHAALTRALSATPSSVDYIIEMGQLFEWASVIPELNASSQEENLKAALAYYKLAVSRRPTWPYTWAYIAFIKVQLGEMDEEMFQAFRLANEYGAFVPVVQRRLYWVGLKAWERLPDQERQQFVQLMEVTLKGKLPKRYKHHPKELIRSAVFLNKVAVIDTLLHSPKQKKWLTELENKRPLCKQFECIPQGITRYQRRFH